MSQYADVILPLPLKSKFTYLLPPDLVEGVCVGSRVIVPFGGKKIYTAIVVALHKNAPEGYAVKPIYELLDADRIVLPQQLRLWEWIADYYLCTVGEVFKAGLPSGLKLESESIVQLNEEFVADGPLPPREQHLLDLLSQKPEQNITALQKESGYKNILTLTKSLLERGALRMKEEVRRAYKPKIEVHLRLTEAYHSEDALRTLLADLGRAPKQIAILLRYLELSQFIAAQQPNSSLSLEEVSRKELLEQTQTTSSVIEALIQKGVFEAYSYEVGRLTEREENTKAINPLNEVQQAAFTQINETFPVKNVTLLHGVTSSGKTEVYIHLIQQYLAAGKQVLYLLPEIALTTQITTRLAAVFGDKMGVYHSKFSDAERVEIWQKQLSTQPYQLILGVRSSIFLPFQQLGLIIVDEEHENSYKQQSPAPRYNARDAAIMLAHMTGAKTLLGTATPSLESYHKCQTGKYGLVEMLQRYQNVELPEIELVDCKELRRKKRMKGAFSPQLVEEVKLALEEKRQVILFQNRRGFAPILECRTCGWVPKCTNCDVSLTYHKRLNQLTCHYCGYTYTMPTSCASCQGTSLSHVGLGTEKVEEEIQALFPAAKTARMDLDTTRTRTAYEKIIFDFQNHQTDILIGTQMVSKGLDFGKVKVVGIINADTMLNFPDFRSHERTFQMLAQVSGRAGRRGEQGKVILQTKSIDTPVIQQVMQNNYLALYAEQLEERQLFNYPPYCRLVYIYLKHKRPEVIESLAYEMASRLRTLFGNRILGPDKPPVARVQMYYIRKIILKVEADASMASARNYLRQLQQQIADDPRWRGALFYYDVDPM